jgi:CheY-like chemotaxis protein
VKGKRVMRLSSATVIEYLKTFAGAPDPAAEPQPAPLVALVVDDEEAVRKFVARVLHEYGCNVMIASDGPDAIRTAACQPVDVLVTDMMMPQMLGDELARRLRQSHADLKVLYLTGFSDRLFAEKLTLWEGEAFLEKPCSPSGLMEAVSLLVFGRFGVKPLSSVTMNAVRSEA